MMDFDRVQVDIYKYIPTVLHIYVNIYTNLIAVINGCADIVPILGPYIRYP